MTDFLYNTRLLNWVDGMEAARHAAGAWQEMSSPLRVVVWSEVMLMLGGGKFKATKPNSAMLQACTCDHISELHMAIANPR